MSAPVTVSVQHLSKKFSSHLRRSLWYGLCDIGRELLPFSRPGPRLRPAEFWSLQNVSFELRRGEALAILGTNGAGKSTLLKVLNGLLKPDAGRVAIRGRVGALIELGVGLDPALSGRENIFVRAALLGFSRAEVRPRLAEIIAFTELGAAIEMPVQFYSSGMTARLAYAVAAHLNPDVLLVDEVLAVGDFNFQRKCINHMLAYLAQGGSIILVSHVPHHIQSVCQRGLVLEQGQVVFDGSSVAALDRYFSQQFGETGAATSVAVAQPGPDRPVVIEGLEFKGPEAVIAPGDAIEVRLSYHALQPLAQVSWSFFIFTNDGTVCVTAAYSPEALDLPAGRHALTCHIARPPLTAGDYLVKAAIFDTRQMQPVALFGWEDAPARLAVEAEASLEGNVQQIVRQLITLDVAWPQFTPTKI